VLSTEVAGDLYASIVVSVHPVSSARVAETVKLLENTFRLVNIGLINEFAQLCNHLAIDSNEVIKAASTKPFGYMPFFPGPGAGGHCIPLDPHYLSWTASKYGYYPRFIMLADEINNSMADHIVQLVGDALNEEGKAMRGARILVLGISYKADVDDVRMSPAIPIIERIRAKGSYVRYHDPFVERLQVADEELPPARRRDLRANQTERRQAATTDLAALISQGRRRDDPLESQSLTDAELQGADCVVVITAHSAIDYARVARLAVMLFDGDGRVHRAVEAAEVVVDARVGEGEAEDAGGVDLAVELAVLGRTRSAGHGVLRGVLVRPGDLRALGDIGIRGELEALDVDRDGSGRGRGGRGRGRGCCG